MKPFKVESFRTSDRRALHLAARELGHGLHTRPPNELASIRRELSEITEDTSSEYARGFLDAIEHVMAGLSAEVKHRRALADDVASARLRKNASKVLLALHSGCDLPSEIADKAELKPPAVSAELTELEREGLVERAERSAGEDQRKSPRALTVRGMQIAEELARTHVSPTAEAARDLAPLYIRYINEFADEWYLAPRRLEELAVQRLGVVDGKFAYTEFMKHAERTCVIAHANSVVTLTSAFYRRRFRDLLEDAQSTDKRTALLEPMKQLAAAGDVCLRVTAVLRYHWTIVLSAHNMRNVYAWCRDDARAQQLPSPVGQYHIVWENPEVMLRDLDDQDLKPFLSQAIRQLCYVATPLLLPPGVERIEVDADHVGR